MATIMAKGKARTLAQQVLRGGSFACDMDGNPSVCGVHRFVLVDGVKHVLYGICGQAPSHGDMVAQLAQALRDASYD